MLRVFGNLTSWPTCRMIGMWSDWRSKDFAISRAINSILGWKGDVRKNGCIRLALVGWRLSASRSSWSTWSQVMTPRRRVFQFLWWLAIASDEDDVGFGEIWDFWLTVVRVIVPQVVKKAIQTIQKPMWVWPLDLWESLPPIPKLGMWELLIFSSVQSQ